jgi:ubiquinone/menaquinone biosynthesis C-methylase UbiE
MQKQPVNRYSTQLTSLEEARIRTAYAKRQDESRYSCFDIGNLFMIQDRERQFLALLKKYGFGSLTTKNILEIGCGKGDWLRDFIKWGAQPDNISGVDLLADRVAKARQLCPESVKIHCGNAATLPFPDATFDLVFQATVFTSILDTSMKRQIACEMLRVVKDDGLILWYDNHISNPWNLDTRGVKKQEIYQLFPDCQIHLRRITLAPPIYRLLAPYSWLICYLLEKIPCLCTHYLGVIRKGKVEVKREAHV